MKMSDVKVGMRLHSTISDTEPEITVTEITDKGFKYKVDEERCVHPRLGITFAKDGHEHFGINGEALYDPINSEYN